MADVLLRAMTSDFEVQSGQEYGTWVNDSDPPYASTWFKKFEVSSVVRQTGDPISPGEGKYHVFIGTINWTADGSPTEALYFAGDTESTEFVVDLELDITGTYDIQGRVTQGGVGVNGLAIGASGVGQDYTAYGGYFGVGPAPRPYSGVLAPVNNPERYSPQEYALDDVWMIISYEFRYQDPPNKPTDPTPANSATSINVGLALLEWDGDGDTYDVYFGTNSESLSLLAGGITTTYLGVVGPYSYRTDYYWRVDASNDYGTTEGDVWTFTTAKIIAPTCSYTPITSLGPLDGGTAGIDFVWNGSNNMRTTRYLVAAANNRVWYETF